MDRLLVCAVIGDINGSRNLSRRARVQEKFEGAIVRLNREYAKAIASNFVLTIGDEFQGLLRSPSESVSCIRRFRELMEPVSFSFGVGVGGLSTPLKPERALGMDGEAFHRARAALTSAKHGGQLLAFDFPGPAMPLVNALVGLMEKQWSRLTPRQREIAALLRKHKRQRTVARRLGISQPAVSKSASAADIAHLRQAETALQSFLDSLIPS